ncbi:MAG TPA: hypothetical protein VGA59_03510 [Ramlibacter sp.]
MWNWKLMWVAWPAFLSACALELVVFAMVDPQDLQWFGQPVALSRQGVYTVSFFVFWAISGLSNALTALLGTPPAVVNGCPIAPGERPDGCPQQ